jgi:hypothetical protein
MRLLFSAVPEILIVCVIATVAVGVVSLSPADALSDWKSKINTVPDSERVWN